MMRLAACITAAVMLLLGVGAQVPADDGARRGQPGVRFAAVEVWIDTQGEPLAAYQLDFQPTRGNVKIVGIEGSSHELFSEPPYYDPAAMMSEHVVVADFSTAPGSALPSGSFRLATIHVQITGNIEPAYDVQLDVAANTDGQPIPFYVTTSIESQP